MAIEIAPATAKAPSGYPEWIESTLHRTPGRDPLGLATITTDRIIPRLVPGVLALSVRARYFSYYAFLLDEYERLQLPPSASDLSAFVKRREYEYALAVQLCPRGCGATASGVVGKVRAGPAASEDPPEYIRNESVESHLGGYGLYYRSPLVALGVVAPAGVLLGDTMTPVDVLWRDDQSRALAGAFRAAIEPTAYYQEHMRSVDPIPGHVLRELAEVACLCRLPDFPQEQVLLRRMLLDRHTQPAGSLQQRRRSFALYLRLLDRFPQIAGRNVRSRDSASVFRHAIWDSFVKHIAATTALAEHLAQWGSLVAKEFMQEALCSIWYEFCTLGGSEQGDDGMAPAEVVDLMRSGLVPNTSLTVPGGQVDVRGDTPTGTFAEHVFAVTEHTPLEAVRDWAATANTALAGLVLLLVLGERVRRLAPEQSGWHRIGLRGGDRQVGLLRLLRWVDDHLAAGPSLSDTMQAIVERFVLRPHEAIAYAKFPNFTFRYRWEEGRLRFYTALFDGRFGLNDIRQDALTRLSWDLGLWDWSGNDAQLTAEGRRLVAGEFGDQ